MFQSRATSSTGDEHRQRERWSIADGWSGGDKLFVCAQWEEGGPRDPVELLFDGGVAWVGVEAGASAGGCAIGGNGEGSAGPARGLAGTERF